MYAQLDDIIFDPINGFGSYSDSEEAIWAEHTPFSGKPTLQPTGNTLIETSVSIRLHQEFINVSEAEAALRQRMRDHKVCTLLWGNGVVEGDFVILRMGRTIEEQDELGNIYSAIYNLDIKEYGERSPLEVRKQLARQAAEAVGDVQPVIRKLPQRRNSVFDYWMGQYNKYLNKVRDTLSNVTSKINNNEFRYNLLQLNRCLNSFNDLAVLSGAADLRDAVRGLIHTAENITNTVLNLLPIVDPTGISSTVTQRLLTAHSDVLAAMTNITPATIVPPAVTTYSGKRKVNETIYAGKGGAMRMRSVVTAREVTDTFNATMIEQTAIVKKALNELYATAVLRGEDTDGSVDFKVAVDKALYAIDQLSTVFPVENFSMIDVRWPAFEEAMQEVYRTSILWTMALVTRRVRIIDESGVGYWAIEVDLIVTE